MKYSVRITRTAEHDLQKAVEYIEFVLLNPTAADSLLDELETAMEKLSLFPEAFPIIPDSVLKEWNIRFVPVKNYLAFYTIFENEIYLVRFLYAKRDWISILQCGSLPE